MKCFTSEERAVSPVIGVILMVAITVILAAVIGAFVLGLGDGIGQNPQAAVTFDDDGSGEVVVTVASVQAADSITAEDNEGSESDEQENPSAGDQLTITTEGSSEGTIVVVAELDGQSSVIADHDYDHR